MMLNQGGKRLLRHCECDTAMRKFHTHGLIPVPGFSKTLFHKPVLHWKQRYKALFVFIFARLNRIFEHSSRHCCQPGDRLMLKHLFGRNMQPCLTGTRNNQQAKDRIPANFKEVRMNAYAFNAQDLGPDRGQDLFRPGHRLSKEVILRSWKVWRGKFLFIQLTIRGGWQSRYLYEGGRNHIFWQTVLQVCTQALRREGCCCVWYDIGNEAFSAGPILACHDCNFPNLWQTGERKLNLARLDAEAVYFD